MSMTDPIADMLARIRNTIISRKNKVEMPSSRMKTRIADLLQREGYISGHRVVDGPKGPVLQIELRYDQANRNAILGLKRISRPGQRRYVKSVAIPRVRSGLGVAILSTSRGVMTDRQARQEGVGGEVICEVW